MTSHQEILSFLFGREGKKKRKSSSLKGQIDGFQPRGKPAIAVKQKNNISLCRLCIKKEFNFFSLQWETHLFLFTSMVACSRLRDSRVRVIHWESAKTPPTFSESTRLYFTGITLARQRKFFGITFLRSTHLHTKNWHFRLSQDILRHFPSPKWNFQVQSP